MCTHLAELTPWFLSLLRPIRIFLPLDLYPVLLNPKGKLPVELLQNRDQKSLADIYNRFHVFVFPTEKESLGLVGLEAMACGVPVIASDVPGPSDYVKHNYNGYLFEEGNPRELSKNLTYYMALKDTERLRLINNSLDTARAFDSNTVKVELVKFILD